MNFVNHVSDHIIGRSHDYNITLFNKNMANQLPTVLTKRLEKTKPKIFYIGFQSGK